MADVTDYTMIGDDMRVALDPGEGARAEAGAMRYMSDGIEMRTGADGGLFGGILGGDKWRADRSSEKRGGQARDGSFL